MGKTEASMSDIERDAGRELSWERPPKVRSQLEASRLFAWLRIFGDGGLASPAPTPKSLEAQRNIRAMVEQLGVTGEAEDCTATQASGRAKLSRDRAARARWVDTLATEFKIEQHRKELDGAIEKSAIAYCFAILRHWRGAQGRSDNRSAQQFFRNIKAAAKELRTSQALRNRLEGAAHLINRVETITTPCGAPAVDPEDDISVARATGALSDTIGLRIRSPAAWGEETTPRQPPSHPVGLQTAGGVLDGGRRTRWQPLPLG